jgi:hypothetical protein
MVNLTLKRAVAIAVLAGASIGANAAEQSLGTVSLTEPTAFTGVITGASGTTINDIFTFDLGLGNTQSGYSVVNLPVSVGGASFNTALATLTLVSNVDGIVGNSDDTILKSVVIPSPGNNPDHLSLQWNAPITDHAYLNVTGITNGGAGGVYAGAIAAIPEPETYAMLLAGLGLMGAVVRRRRQS